MKTEEFNELVGSIREAGKIWRGEIELERVTELKPAGCQPESIPVDLSTNSTPKPASGKSPPF